MELNEWWIERPNENFWLEITNRDDLGADLNAPKLKENGKPYWGYTLMTRARAGDVVFHYYSREHAIVACSVVSGAAWEDTVFWAAQSTAARDAGVTPYHRPGWRRGLENFRFLENPINLEEMRKEEAAIRKIRDRLQSSAKKPLYLPFEFSEKRPMRPSSPYFSKLPHDIVKLFETLGLDYAPTRSTATAASTQGNLGQKYRRADETCAVSSAEPFQVDPALVERGLLGHRRTQNNLASFLQERGITPRSPSGDEPNYDLAWVHDGRTFVAEVKSTTQKNEEKQLRLGLGQVLRYAHLFPGKVVPVLIPENELHDASWYATCESVGVLIIPPSKFESLVAPQ